MIVTDELLFQHLARGFFFRKAVDLANAEILLPLFLELMAFFDQFILPRELCRTAQLRIRAAVLGPGPNLEILIRVVPETQINIIISNRSSCTVGDARPFIRSKRIRMRVVLRDGQRAVQSQQMNGIAKIAETASNTRLQMVGDDDTAIFISFSLARPADGSPKRKGFARMNDQSIKTL